MQYTKTKNPNGVYFSFSENGGESYYFDTRTESGKLTADCFEADAEKATDYICHIHAPWNDNKLMDRDDLHSLSTEQALEEV